MNIPEYNDRVSTAIEEFHAKVNEAREELDRELSTARSLLFERQDKAVTADRPKYA
jgi:vacuolar-type H+-ATPase subunit H